MIDREREWATLEEVWRSDGPELVFVVGRRRVGKSYLLTRFAAEHEGLYYQATRRTEAEQLRAISGRLGERFEDRTLRRGVALPDWEAVFEYVIDAAAGDRCLVVLDEFPYLAEAAPALPSIVQSLWDHALASTRVKLVLSGSYITAMARLERGDQPLHGRRTRQIRLNPFRYDHASEFLPGYGARDRLVAYGVFGGLPGHLALLDPDRSLAENVGTRVLSPSGRLFEEGGHVLDAFLGDSVTYYSILDAIAGGEHRWSRIASRVGKKAASLNRPLQWLVEMEFVERVWPITEGLDPNPKRVRYRLRDPYLAFWYSFVAPLASSGVAETVPAERIWETIADDGLDEHMGPVFEAACRDFVRRGEGLPFRPVRVGEWWDAASENQVDLVALDGKGRLLCGECKWGGVGRNDLATLHRRADAVAAGLGGVRRVDLALFSGRGVEDRATREAIERGEVAHVPAERLFEW